MAPTTVKPHMEDLLRIGIDRGTIISDRLYAGSDTYATSIVLARYISSQIYNIILTGTHAIDGDTAHIPSQIGACLNLNQMSNIVRIDEEQFSETSAIFDVETENAVVTYEMALPSILSITRESKYKLPYVSRKDMERNVSEAINIVTNKDLAFEPEEVGLKGSLTKVISTYTKEFDKKNRIVVKADDEGIDLVYKYLKDKGFI